MSTVKQNEAKKIMNDTKALTNNCLMRLDTQIKAKCNRINEIHDEINRLYGTVDKLENQVMNLQAKHDALLYNLN